MKYAYCARQGNWGHLALGWLVLQGSFVSNPVCSFRSYSLHRPSTAFCNELASRGPLLAPSSEDRDWPDAVPESPSSPQTCTGDIKFSLSYGHPSSHGSRGIGCLGRLQPHACPASKVPQRARPPIVHTLPTAMDCVLRLLASWADQVPACPPQSPPSAPMSSDPPLLILLSVPPGCQRKKASNICTLRCIWPRLSRAAYVDGQASHQMCLSVTLYHYGWSKCCSPSPFSSVLPRLREL